MILNISKKLQKKFATRIFILSHSCLPFSKTENDVEGKHSNKNSTMKNIV